MVALLTMLPVSAAGSVSTSLSVSDKTVNSGDKITITVSAKVDTCGSGGIEISYDSSVFELTSGDWVLGGTFMKDFDAGKKDGVFAFDSASKISGKVFKFVLKVKSSAPVGKSNVSVKFKADAKSASASTTITVSCAHSYSDKCDTSCNKCGATRKITHSWDGGTVLKEASCTTDGSAKFTCKVCGETKTEKVDKTPHSYDHNCDTSCNVCGETRQIQHTFAWSCDTSEHWQACAVCGEQQDRGAHSLAETVSGNDTGHGYACSVCALIPKAEAHVFDSSCDADCASCGYLRTVTHVYSERYTYDKDGHWFACVLCGDELEKFPHVPGEAATETTDQICTQCGYIIETAGNHVHSMGGDWLSDDNGHWYQCRCGGFADSMEHRWDAGTLNEMTGIITYLCEDCGHFKTEIYVPETEPVEEPTGIFAILDNPRDLILAGALCVSLIVNLCLLIGVIVLRKRSNRNEP